jgi:redox-sensitive bicupin YhaK (pirin superfamily)
MRCKIKKKFRFSIHSQCGWRDEIKVQHALPNQFARAIGPFVFFEHILAYERSLNEMHNGPLEKRPNPHRGITILTYSLAGQVEHLDSIGNQVKVCAGGVHWTKAGKGIIYYETVRSEFQVANSDVSVVRVWINLPSYRKSEQPDYLSILSNQIPKQLLDAGAGWIKILLGEYKNVVAEIPYYSKEFFYHVHLEAGKQFPMIAEVGFEYAAFILANMVIINNREFQAGELIVFTALGEIIEMKNKNNTAVDIILFGGEPYIETVVSDGNFVMNTPHEITQAYNDYYDGKYGKIKDH